MQLDGFFQILLVTSPFIVITEINGHPVIVIVMNDHYDLQKPDTTGNNGESGRVPIKVQSRLYLPVHQFSVLLLPGNLIQRNTTGYQG